MIAKFIFKKLAHIPCTVHFLPTNGLDKHDFRRKTVGRFGGIPRPWIEIIGVVK